MPACIESLYDSEVHGGNCWLEPEAPPQAFWPSSGGSLATCKVAGESTFIHESDSVTAQEGVLAQVPTWSSRSWSSASVIGVVPPDSMTILSSLTITSLSSLTPSRSSSPL